jgi:transcription elongation factor Elf1
LSMDVSIPVPPIFACLACNRKEFAFDIVQIVLALHIEACGICNC